MAKTNFIKTIAAIILLLTSIHIFSQNPLPRVVTGEDFLGRNLPANIFDIEVDARGFVYLVYPGGLWVFNGHETRSEWKQKNPYDPNLYFALHKGYNDQILLSGPFGVAHIKGDSIIKFSIPDSLVQFGRRGYETVYNDKNGLLHIAPRYKGYFTVDSSGNTEELVGQSSGIHGFVTTQLEDGKILSYSIVPKGTKSKIFNLYSSIADTTLQHIAEIDRPLHEASLVQYKDGSFVFSNGKNDIIHFDKNGLLNEHNFDFEVIKLFIDSSDVLWIGTAGNGFFKVESLKNNLITNYLDGSSAVVTEGFDNGLWVKSNSRKMGYISPVNVLNYSDQNGYSEFMDITEIVQTEEQMLVSNKKNQLFSLNDNDFIEIIPPRNIKNSNPFKIPSRNCFDKKTNKIWIASLGHLHSWNGKKWETLEFDKSEFNSLKVPDFKVLDNGKVIGATQNEMFEIRQGKINPISEQIKTKIQQFTIDEYGKYWIGTTTGIWTLDKNKFIRPFEDMPEKLSTACQFITYSQGALWYQPLVDGLYIIKQDSIIPVFDQDGSRITLFTSAVSPNGDLWGINSANKKLCRLKLKNSKISIQYFEFDDLATFGLPRNGLVVTDKEIFIGSTYGLFKQSLNELTAEEIPSKVEITELRINHELMPIKDIYKLPHNENYLNITFEGISFRRLQLEYSYKMIGLDTLWRSTKHRHVQYTNLPPGKYDFNLRVKTSQSDWTVPKVLTFDIEKPYWQKWWFWLACLISFLSLSILGIQFWVNNARKKEAEKGKIALELSRLELRALKAQMNPHFIFNTLKSIQNRILKEGKWEANDLLVRFSKLIRSSLEYSRVDFITLNKEIDFLTNYLEIEKQRIIGKFDYQILIDNIEDIQDLLIPSLLIQPICENAINHAFEKGNGNLTLNLKMISQDLIEVVITDDGIGYFKIQNIDQDAKHSRGLEIVQSRLELFKLQGYKTTAQIEPLNEITKQGTKVTLRLPCK